MALPISKDIVDLQDIEKIQFLTSLQADPAAYASYVGEKSDRIMAETVDTKRASFVKVSSDMARMMDMDHNSIASLQRTNELINTENTIIAQQQNQLNSRTSNNDLTRRQVEINNWYYENKRETLFVLQFILLIVLTVVIVLYLAHSGWLTQDSADYIIGFIIIVGAGVWMYRWYYTTYIRDARYWSKRSFNTEKKLSGDSCPPPPAPPPRIMPTCPPGNVFDAPSGMCISITTASVAPTCPDGMVYSISSGACM